MGMTAVQERKDAAESAYGPLGRLYMRVAMKIITAVNRWLLTCSRGRIGFSFLGQSVLLLHTVGRKTGRPYATPLFYMEDGNNLVLVASRAGTAVNPGWLRNLEANPEVDVQLRDGTRRVRAHLASEEERSRLWPRLVQMFEPWDDIQQKTRRQFPIVVLERIDTPAAEAART